MGSARCSIWLPTHDGGLICTSAVGDTGYAAVHGRVLPPDLVARFSPRSAPFVTTPEESALIGRAVSLEAAAATHAIVFVPLDQGLAMLAVVAESAVRSRELELLAGIASQARLPIPNAGRLAKLRRQAPHTTTA